MEKQEIWIKSTKYNSSAGFRGFAKDSGWVRSNKYSQEEFGRDCAGTTQLVAAPNMEHLGDETRILVLLSKPSPRQLPARKVAGTASGPDVDRFLQDRTAGGGWK